MLRTQRWREMTLNKRIYDDQVVSADMEDFAIIIIGVLCRRQIMITLDCYTVDASPSPSHQPHPMFLQGSRPVVVGSSGCTVLKPSYVGSVTLVPQVSLFPRNSITARSYYTFLQSP